MNKMAQITYDDKVALNENTSVAEINKVTDDDMNEIKTAVNTNTPVGSISLFAGTTAPTGWLICDGSAISRTTYADLFSVIGTTYGTGDGSTTFNIPDLQGRVPVGYKSSDTSFDTLGETGGEKAHTLSIDEMPRHNHEIHAAIGGGGQINGGFNAASGNEYYNIPLNLTSESNFINTWHVGNSQAHNILQPYIVMNYIISY